MRGAATLKKPLPATEQAATMALRSAGTSDELVSVWWRDADAFDGEARERLQAVYSEMLARFAPMGRSG